MKLDEFVDSAPLLGDPPALRARLGEDGYLFVRGALDPEVLTDLRHQIGGVLAEHGWTRPGTDPTDAVAEGDPCYEGEKPYLTVYDDVQRLEAFHALSHHDTVLRLLRDLLGETTFPHPLSIARLVFPGEEAEATPPHQDFPNNQGTEDLLTCWVPLSDCPVSFGGLSVLRGSHRLGLLPRTFAIGPGYRQAVLDDRHASLDWVGGDFALGDVLVFHSLTVHRALPNRTDRIRISVDYRFQREGEALTAHCMEPHFGRLSWEEIYAGWERPDLQWYWREKQFAVVPFDRELLDQAAGHVDDSMLEWMTWRRDHPERDFDPMEWFREDPAAAVVSEDGPAAGPGGAS